MTKLRPDIPGVTVVENVRAGTHVTVARGVRQGQEVAIKWANGEVGNVLVAWEASIVAELAQEGLPICLVRGHSHGLDHLVTSWISGVVFSSMLRTSVRRELLTPKTAVALAAAMAQVVATLHDRRPPLIHCDLSADNFILQPDGRVALIDFGVSQPLGVAPPDEISALRPSLAPESLVDAPVDVCSDVYMLGATLYELVTGKVPYPMFPSTFDENEAYQRRLRRHVAPVGELRPDLAPELAAAIDAAVRPLHPSRVALDVSPLPPRSRNLAGFTAMMPNSATRAILRPLARRLMESPFEA